MLPCASKLLLGSKEVSQGLLGTRKCELASHQEKQAGRKKTMLGGGGSHNTEVLNCHQQCENDAIKDS